METRLTAESSQKLHQIGQRILNFMDIEVRSQAFYLDLAVILMNYRVHKTDTYAGSKHPTGERKLAKKFFNDEILPKLVEVAKVDALRRDILLAFIIEGMVERVIWP